METVCWGCCRIRCGDTNSLSLQVVLAPIIALLLIALACSARAEEIKITTGEWEPFLSEKYKNGGVILDIVKEAFNRKGIDVKYKFLPWARAVKFVDDGTWDAMAVTGSRHSDKGIEHLYSDPVYVGTDVIFHRKEFRLNWRHFPDLHGLAFGTVLSYDYSDEFRQAVAEGSVRSVLAPEAHLLFPMLAAKRFDVFIMDKRAGMYTYNTQYRDVLGDVITYSPRPLSTLAYSMRFSGKVPGNKRFLSIFNESLREMHEDGTVERLYEQFENGAYHGT
ncbi:substrate-binding periplasmic protein [Hwanghaeella sp.]|uniref:substrate-binding periplasmic protein n=1 Tax=Hwanghaeella sp. TaxID=2605943 RepID=UPI003CCB86F2